ncbi:hypothetical protein K470DRAFT_269302 [Piedraia hortae CBS 480.64]|uniref:Uncharacterized protein n=1 Tax=Piedraia hortae CBS 480.64 TaxID=1314780 RepID=A0A6A7C4Q8_9PEZI|nr:hypothetical protein K470DRAFT_269302 [Piedraia hortae CBS 480.64]
MAKETTPLTEEKPSQTTNEAKQEKQDEKFEEVQAEIQEEHEKQDKTLTLLCTHLTTSRLSREALICYDSAETYQDNSDKDWTFPSSPRRGNYMRKRRGGEVLCSERHLAEIAAWVGCLDEETEKGEGGTKLDKRTKKEKGISKANRYGHGKTTKPTPSPIPLYRSTQATSPHRSPHRQDQTPPKRTKPS